MKKMQEYLEQAIKNCELTTGQTRKIDEFNIQVATVNGSGSQTANTVLIRSIFQMGIPVSGKNLFPSNIMGMPTWFSIRTSLKGYVARKETIEILVAMNSETATEDINKLKAGAVVVFDAILNLLQTLRDDLIFYPVPFDSLVKNLVSEVKLRKLIKNMVYVGVLAYLLGIEMTEVEIAIKKQFRKKLKTAELNYKAAQVGYEYAEKHLIKKDPYLLERKNLTQGKIIIDGNSAAALGCMFAGVTVVAWYPITPASSLCESLIDYMKHYRTDKTTGKTTYAIVQAEDELAALGMVIGAGWAGARAMTATSGPGVSLMSEFVGFGYYAEVPAVIIDVQRVGPSTGLPTRTAQSDILSIVFLSHGDTKHVLLFPSSVEECYSMCIEAFDLADELQTPVFVMTDLDLGMNSWMANKFAYPAQPLRRGKILSESDLDRVKEYARYRDVDGDGITYRTLPGNRHPIAAYFTRGSSHNEKALYTECPEEYIKVLDRLKRKYETARQKVPPPLIDYNSQSSIGLIAYGSSHWAVTECRDILIESYGVNTSYLLLKAIPLNSSIKEFIQRHERVYVIEQNRDAQLHQLLRMEFALETGDKLRSIRHYDGLPITSENIVRQILSQEGIQQK